MKVRFTKNPDRYNLAYREGDETELPDALAKTLCEDGYAVDANLKTEDPDAGDPDPEKSEAAETATLGKGDAETTTANPKRSRK